jgi:hypothetical protein
MPNFSTNTITLSGGEERFRKNNQRRFRDEEIRAKQGALSEAARFVETVLCRKYHNCMKW